MSRSLPTDHTIRAYPAHGAVISDASAKLQEYIAHRQQREDEIVEALKKGGTINVREANDHEQGMTPMDIVKVVYKGYPESLHEPAAKGVGLVLKKLEEEGKVRKEEGYGWVLVAADGKSGENGSRSAL